MGPARVPLTWVPRYLGTCQLLAARLAAPGVWLGLASAPIAVLRLELWARPPPKKGGARTLASCRLSVWADSGSAAIEAPQPRGFLFPTESPNLDRHPPRLKGRPDPFPPSNAGHDSLLQLARALICVYGQAHSSQPLAMASKEPLSSKKYVDGIYIPAGLLVVGVAIVKKEWLPYAVLVTLALSAIKFWRSRKFSVFPLLLPRLQTTRARRTCQLTALGHRTPEGPQA